MAAVREQWLQSSLLDFDARKAQELARIDRVETEAWAAWEKSKRAREITTTERITREGGDRAKAALTAMGVQNLREAGRYSLHMDDPFGYDVQISGLEAHARALELTRNSAEQSLLRRRLAGALED